MVRLRIVFLVWFLCSVAGSGQVFAADPTIVTPLSTQGRQIIDANGQPITLKGVNWFGFEVDTNVVHGLWARDYKSMITQIKAQGFNSIRLPYSIQSMRAGSTNSINYSLGANSELQSLTPLQTMDKVIQAAAAEGLLVLLDNHRNSSYSIPELWYGDGYTEQDWVDTVKAMAERYKNQPNVIGMDLKNEPHGAARWGNGDTATDWRLAAERAGNAIQVIAPHWLIVVEGVEGPVIGQQLSGHWWGGNLEAAGAFPVRLNVPNKLVYSVHEYGDGVANVPWFNDPAFPNNLDNRWQLGFFYLMQQNIAPVLVGEFGGRDVGTSGKEGIWQNKFVDYLRDNNISFMYWSWNPNSGDTGGILQDDWSTVHADKMAMLRRVLDEPFPSAVVCARTADINTDGNVNILDYTTLASQWFQSGSNLSGDINCDGTVNLIDYTLLVQSFSL